MAVNTAFLDELEGKTSAPQEYFAPPPTVKRKKASGINHDFLDSLEAGEHPEVQGNKAAIKDPQPMGLLDAPGLLAPEDPEYDARRGFESIKPGPIARALGRWAELGIRGGQQAVNAAIIQPLRKMYEGSALGKFDADLALFDDKEFKEYLNQPPERDEKGRVIINIGELNRLWGKAQSKVRKDIAQSIPGFEVPAPETPGEKLTDITGKTIGGIAGFIGRVLAFKKVLGGGGWARDTLAWELESEAMGGAPGTGAAMRLSLGAIAKIPTGSVTGKVAKVATQSGLFATTTALSGGDKTDILVSALIPPVFNVWHFAKQKQYLTNYEAGLKNAAYQEYQGRIKKGVSPATSAAHLKADQRLIVEAVAKAKQKIYRDNAFAPTKEKWETQRKQALELIASGDPKTRLRGENVLNFLGDRPRVPPEPIETQIKEARQLGRVVRKERFKLPKEIKAELEPKIVKPKAPTAPVSAPEAPIPVTEPVVAKPKPVEPTAVVPEKEIVHPAEVAKPEIERKPLPAKAVTEEKVETSEELESLKRANPALFSKAQKATDADEFIDSVVGAGKTTRDKVSIPVLTDFYNKVKGIAQPPVEGKGIFIRKASPEEIANPQKAMMNIPRREGYKTAYKPYGEQGKGFYYIPEAKPEVKPAPVAKPEVKKPAKAAIKEKQSWEMTRKEYEADPGFQRVYGQTEGKNREAALSVHKVDVEEAVEAGKPVPIEVIEGYKGEEWADEAIAKLKPQPKAIAEPDISQVHPKSKAAVDDAILNRDAETLKKWLHKGNKTLRKYFKEITGVKLPDTERDTKTAIDDFVKTPLSVDEKKALQDWLGQARPAAKPDEKVTPGKRFYIYDATGKKFKEVQGQPVKFDEFPGLDLFAWKEGTNWIVGEGRTGTRIGNPQKTKKKALEAALELVKQHKNEIEGAIQDALETTGGISPRYTKKPVPAEGKVRILLSKDAFPEGIAGGLKHDVKLNPPDSASEDEWAVAMMNKARLNKDESETARMKLVELTGREWRTDSISKYIFHIIPEKPLQKAEEEVIVKIEAEHERRETQVKERPGGVREAGVLPLETIPPEAVQAPEGEGEVVRPTVRGRGERPQLPDEGAREAGVRLSEGLSRSEGSSTEDVDTSTRRGPAGRRTSDSRANADYRITEADKIGKGGLKTKYRNNVTAIKLLKQIEPENRLATPEEQAVLVKYVGWGGMPQVFDVHRKEDWAKEYEQLKGLLTEDEYKAARASTPNAHYTSFDTIGGIWEGLVKLGFKGGKINEPSMGVGHFYGLMPDSIATNSKLFGVELDEISGRIAKQLYQSADVQIKGFEKTKYPDNYFDLFISNVPFGDYRVYDEEMRKVKFRIHDFFFAKALEKTRPGGLVVFITSKGTMDKADSSVRSYIAQRADLVGAIRLPNTAFKENANTEVVTDILIFQKRDKKGFQAGEKFKALGEIKKGEDVFHVNEYFVKHPKNILGKMAYTGTMYRGQEMTVEPKRGLNLAEEIRRIIGGFQAPVDINAKEKEINEQRREPGYSAPAPTHIKENAYVVDKKHRLLQNKSGTLVPADIPNATIRRVKALVSVRDALRALLHKQLDKEQAGAAVETARKKLNNVYRKAVKAYGPLSGQYNQRAFSDDPDLPMLLSLETYDRKNKVVTDLADVFTKRTQYPYKVIEKVETGEEALIASLNEKGKVDVPYMSILLDKSEQDVVAELAGKIYLDPVATQWVPADIYLSGNVRRKLEEAQKAYEQTKEPQWKANAEALEQVQPEDISPVDIDARLGAMWVEAEDYRDFYHHLVGRGGQAQFGKVASEGIWAVEGTGAYGVAETATWGTKRFGALKLMAMAMNQKQPTAYDKVGDKSVINQEETIVARVKQQQIKDEFKKWLWESDPRAVRLARKYNDMYNNVIFPVWDGSHLKLPGKVDDSIIKLRPHQENAVWRYLTTGNTLLAHSVGAGKTYTGVAIAMEARRLGLARKPIFVVPNHLVTQWRDSWMELYPSATILFATEDDFKPKNRQTLMNRISTGDWDGIIVPMSSFEKIPMHPNIVRQFFDEQIYALEGEIRKARGEYNRNLTKELEKAKKRLSAALERQEAKWKKDVGPYFNEMGIDMLFVDEAQEFKNLYFRTQMTRVAGISQSFVQKSFDMEMKTRYINRITDNKGVIFATGTPITNSVSEMFTIQRYLQPDALKERELGAFDAWAQNFGETVTSVEVAPDGSGFRVHTRFAKFTNLPELMQMFRMTTDIQTQEMLKLDVPDVKGGKAVVMRAPQSDELKMFVETLVSRAEKVRKGRVDPRDDNMLKITNDGRKAALDLRLVLPGAKDSPTSKVNMLVDKVREIWERTAKEKSVQVVWCDLSTPKPGQWSIYDDVKGKLIKEGVSAGEIAFIHDVKNKKDLGTFYAKVNSGKVRVVLASTFKMGTGANVQERLIAAHHLDAPWRPADIEQRDGRIIRQGNTHKEVELYRYVTKGSFDAYMWQTLETKAKFITQVMTGKTTARETEDVGDAVLSYAEVKALASGNPKVMEAVQLESEVKQLQALERAHRNQQFSFRRELAEFPQEIAFQEERNKATSADNQKYVAAKEKAGKDRDFTFAGKHYTKRQDAGEALLRIIGGLNKLTVEDVEIGEAYGFRLDAKWIQGIENGGWWRVTIVGDWRYEVDLEESASGNIARILNTFSAIEDKMETSQALAEKFKREQTKVQAKLGEPFEKAGELKDKTGRMVGLQQEIGLDKKSEEVVVAPEEAAGGIVTAVGATRSPQLERTLNEAARTTAEIYVRQINGKWIKSKKRPQYGDYYRVREGSSKFFKGDNIFAEEKRAIQAAKYIAKNTLRPVYLWQTIMGFHVSINKPRTDHVVIEPKGPGLTMEERRILGTPQKIAEAEIAQQEKQKVGYKVGRKAALEESRRKLNKFRMAQKLSDKHRQDAVDIVKQYVPKEQQYRYIKRILAAKTNKRIERLTEAIDAYIDKADHRQAIIDFRNFVKETRSKYGRGETELGRLRKDVRTTLLDVLGKHDIAKLSEAKRERLESRQEYIKNVSGAVADAFESLEEEGVNVLQMPNARITELARLSKMHIGELDADQIRYIQASLEHLLAIAARKGDIKERIRAEKVRDLVHTAKDEVSRRTKELGVVMEKQGIGGFAGKLLTTAQATPRTLVGMFTGKDNHATVELITNNLYKGHEKKTAKAKEFILAARKEIADAGLDSKAFAALDEKTKITLGGKTFRVDLDNLLSIYLHIRAEGNLRRLLKTKGLNITLYERDPSRLYVITKKTEVMTGRPQLSELREIIGIAENTYPNLKKMADTAFKVNREYQAPAINETSMEYQNYELARHERHWPVHRARAKRVEGGATDISVSIENQGRYLPRTGGSERIRIVPFRQEFIASLQSDATYYGMTLPMRNLRALVGNKAWQDKMREAGRAREMNALITMLRRIQSHSTEQTFIDVVGAKVLSNFGKSVLSLRLSGYGVQTASIPAAFEVIEPRHFHGARNIVQLPRIPVAAVKEMMDLSPRLWMRWTGRQFDFVTGGAAAQHAFDTLIFKSSTITEKGVKHYTFGDQKAIYHIYLAAQNKVAAETELKRGSIELKKRAIKLVEKALETQPQWDMVYRTILTSSPNVFLRGSTMFMSARSAQYNVLLRAVDDYRKKRIGSAEFGKRVSGVIYANALVAVVKRMVKLGVKAATLGLILVIGKDEDEEKVRLAAKAEAAKLKGQVPLDVVLNLISLPAFGSIAQTIAYEAIKRFKSHYSTHRLQDIRTGNIFADLSLDVTGVVGDTAQLAKQVMTKERFKPPSPNEGKLKWHRTARQVASGIAELIAIATGLPYSAPRGEVYYQIKSAGAAVEKVMTVEELEEAIAQNTYKRRYKRKDGKWYDRGHAHSGKEGTVKRWREELESRKSR